MLKRIIIVLTGGPGGGKTTLIEELMHDLFWAKRLVVLPEAILLTRFLNISPREPLFQRVKVYLQMALEDALIAALNRDDPRAIIYHRGSLDLLAYWLFHGWSEEEFFAFTRTRLKDHYKRYEAVIHLVTAADGAVQHYKKFPEAHRHESVKEAIKIDRLLNKVWRNHPRYFRLDNEGRDWTAKSQEAHKLLSMILGLNKEGEVII